MNFSNIFFGTALLSLGAAPFVATSQNLGIPSEKKPAIIRQFNDCPASQKDANGNCPRSQRGSSGYYSGGGFSSGK